jgi:hypothetical protein
MKLSEILNKPEDPDEDDFLGKTAKLTDLTSYKHCIELRFAVKPNSDDIEWTAPKDVLSWSEWVGKNGLVIELSAKSKAEAIAGAKKIIDDIKDHISSQVRAYYQIANRHYDHISKIQVDLSHAGWKEISLTEGDGNITEVYRRLEKEYKALANGKSKEELKRLGVEECTSGNIWENVKVLEKNIKLLKPQK